MLAIAFAGAQSAVAQTTATRHDTAFAAIDDRAASFATAVANANLTETLDDPDFQVRL